MKNPPSLTGLLEVGVIGFEPTAPAPKAGARASIYRLETPILTAMLTHFALTHRRFSPLLRM